MRIIKGDLLHLALQQRFDVIIHGCNCFNTMGAGIAKQIAKMWPEAAMVDKDTNLGDKAKLGTFTSVSTHCCTVVNAYTQYRPGPDFSYDAFTTVLKAIEQKYGQQVSYGLPLIGCGYGGADEVKVLHILKEWSLHKHVTIVRYDTNA